MDHEWEKFYAKYRPEDEEAPEELIKLAEEVCKCTSPELIDESNHIVVVMENNKWEDIKSFLETIGTPLPRYVEMSPMHADTRKMSNMLNTRSKHVS